MQVARNHPWCGVCGSKLVKNGVTSSGRTRWRCKTCGASSTQSRPDITHRAELTAFHQWVLGSASQRSLDGGTGRSFRSSTSWCWRIRVPRPVVTGEIDRVLMLDGTYLQDWCLLIAFTGQYVRGWQWCDRETKAAYQVLLHRLPGPDLVVTDGSRGALAAIATEWPDTAVQRCYFHIFQTVTRHLTMNPRLEAGKQLRALTTALMRVSTLDEATEWTRLYMAWEADWDSFLKHRTYAGTHTERPTGIGECQQWWYTHRDLRKCRTLFRDLIRRKELFCWLTTDTTPLPRTTSPLEGGPTRPSKTSYASTEACPKPTPDEPSTGSLTASPSTPTTHGASPAPSTGTHQPRPVTLSRNPSARHPAATSPGKTATASKRAGQDAGSHDTPTAIHTFLPLTLPARMACGQQTASHPKGSEAVGVVAVGPRPAAQCGHTIGYDSEQARSGFLGGEVGSCPLRPVPGCGPWGCGSRRSALSLEFEARRRMACSLGLRRSVHAPGNGPPATALELVAGGCGTPAEEGLDSSAHGRSITS